MTQILSAYHRGNNGKGSCDAFTGGNAIGRRKIALLVQSVLWLLQLGLQKSSAFCMQRESELQIAQLCSLHNESRTISQDKRGRGDQDLCLISFPIGWCAGWCFHRSHPSPMSHWSPFPPTVGSFLSHPPQQFHTLMKPALALPTRSNPVHSFPSWAADPKSVGRRGGKIKKGADIGRPYAITKDLSKMQDIIK